MSLVNRKQTEISIANPRHVGVRVSVHEFVQSILPESHYSNIELANNLRHQRPNVCMCVRFVVHYCKFHPLKQTAIHQALPSDRRKPDSQSSVIQTKLHKLPHPPVIFFPLSFFFEENKRKLSTKRTQ